MDEYTKKTKLWLDERFKETDEKGIYKSHAPIYGFSREHIFLGLYKNNFAILKETERLISRYSIKNFLEVGCAEGYTANLIRKTFGFKTYVIDLSLQALKRAKEIYNLDGIVADCQRLELIKTESFDLVLCSETIEHLPNSDKAFSELLRITKKALIITVPAAKNLKEKQMFKPKKEPNAHLNIFTKEDLEELFSCHQIRGISIKWLDKIESLFTEDGKSVSYQSLNPIMIAYRIGRFFSLPFRKFYGANMAKFFIKLDYCLGRIFIFDAITYMGIYLKTRPDFDRKIKKKNILDFMLNKSKVDHHFIT